MSREEVIRQLKLDLRRDEGLRLKPYRDSVGNFTVGIGRNLDDVGVSPEEAMFMLENDIEHVTQQLDRTLPWWQGLNENRQRALANMAFNLGIGGLLKFKKMLAALEAGDYERASDEALDSRWARQVGQRAQRIAALLRGE